MLVKVVNECKNEPKILKRARSLEGNEAKRVVEKMASGLGRLCNRISAGA